MAGNAPRRSVARPSGKKNLSPAEAKETLLGLLAQGLKVEEACAAVGRTRNTYLGWVKEDPEFRAARDRVRELQTAAGDSGGRMPIPDFPEFCAELGKPMAPHQLAMWEVANEGTPTWMHPSFKLQRGIAWDSDVPPVPGGRVVINAPPGFSKSTHMTMLFSTWLIHKNPDVRIIIVCRDQGLAKQMLGHIKSMLTSSIYRELHAKYAPEGGWKDPDASWTQTEIFVQGRGAGEKDPTVQALGIGGRIYGARADVIILDDAVTGTNVNEYEKQARWIEQEVESRLDGRGLLLVLGTRLAPCDLYSTLRDVTVLADDEEDPDDVSEVPRWTYFSMPAVIDYGDGNWKNWTSLWPARFPPGRLRKMRVNEAVWALTFQQQDVAEDATFNARAVEASINSQRFPGPMNPGAMGGREDGMANLWRVGTVDPAAAGCTAMIIGGVDRVTGKRYVMDGFNNRNTSAQLLKDTMKRFTEQYRLNEWVIEANAFQRYLTQDADLVDYLRARGVRLTPHMTGTNKLDPDFGVMGMAPLFESCGEPPAVGNNGKWRRTPEKALIELPSPAQNAWVGELVNQLVVWQPSGMKQLQKTDLVMALWFFNIAANRILGHNREMPCHLHNPFLNDKRARTRQVVDLAEAREALRREKEVAM